MGITRGMMSSDTPEWATPQALFDALDAEFHFGMDVCATAENAKCALYFTRDDDGLAQEWYGSVWMNPPYGREIGHWVKKAFEASLAGATVVCLLPARTDTAWWHDYVMRVWPTGIRLLRGRVRFNDSGPAPFPSAVVVFSPVDTPAGELLES